MPGRGSLVVSHARDTLARHAPLSVGRPLTALELDSFDRYLELLQRWQKAQRLVGSTEPEWVVENLFLDSLLFIRLLPVSIHSLADLGSGAGFPGIPIKIVCPHVAVTLIESRERRASFLAAAVRELHLGRVRVLNARAEQVADEMPGSFSAVVTRCAGDPHRVIPIAAKLVAPGGIVIAAGSPGPRLLPAGAWHEVTQGPGGRTRKFAVHRV